MKKFNKKIASIFLVFFFTSALFCCSFCGIAHACSMAQAKAGDTGYSAPTLISNQNLHPCCCPGKNCTGSSISSVLQNEKSDNFFVKNVRPQFSKIYSLSGKHFTNAYLAFFSSISYHSLPQSLPKTVPIYLSNRVLRL